jgi:FkbM family methyltransferase
MATLYLKWRYPNATIHSFEPDPSAFSMLERNIKTNNLENVFLYNNAAMAEEGELDFYTAASHKASLMMSTVASRMDEQKITVKGIDFADFLNKTKPTLLKIDIEGAEKKVFPKLKETGALSHLQQIVMEYHHMIDRSGSDFSKMLQTLEESGFEYNLITHFNEPGTFQDVLLYAFKPKQ